jgi:hypothetical protein
MAMQVGEPLFAQYEDAVDSFLRAGGHTPSVIRSPPGLLKQYRSQFAESLKYAAGVRIEEAEQDFVSVRGTTIAGHVLEYPEPG